MYTHVPGLHICELFCFALSHAEPRRSVVLVTVSGPTVIIAASEWVEQVSGLVAISF